MAAAAPGLSVGGWQSALQGGICKNSAQVHPFTVAPVADRQLAG